MFAWWGDLVSRLRFAVIGVMVAALLGLGAYGLGLDSHLSGGGIFDPNSESSEAGRIVGTTFERGKEGDVVVMYTAPSGTTVDDPEFSATVVDSLKSVRDNYTDQISAVAGYWPLEPGQAKTKLAATEDKTRAVVSVGLNGNSDAALQANYRTIKDAFAIPGVDVQVGGLQPVTGALNDTVAEDLHRMELLAIPLVGVLLFFIFGGVVAAALPLIIGLLTIFGAFGIVRFVTNFTEVNSFVSPVVSMIGLGLAIDYGLFIVSRFREEVAAGYDTRTAVRRSVMTAGRTVVFSATMIAASLGGLLLFPQGFLKSIAYGAMATVAMAALTAITILPAMLAVLGPRVDMLGLKRFRRPKSAAEVDNGFLGRVVRLVMRYPLRIAVPVTLGLILLILPMQNLVFGGYSEKYLPPDHPVRVAQAQIDRHFPLRKTDPIELVIITGDSKAVGSVWDQANAAPGLIGKFEAPARSTIDPDVRRTKATVVDINDAGETIDYLRSLDLPEGTRVLVGGVPALQKDSIDALLVRIPFMIALVLLVSTLLMFLTFGSLVLPIKAALMSGLGLGSTLGIVTWIFVEGHGAELLNFTPQPGQVLMLVVIIAVVYGLSIDYEVFLLSRMVEARARGASTEEAIRVGTVQTGRIITAAALILLVVTGAFAFSDLVMMQYIAYGMIAALIIDATILRMVLVPAVMKLLGERCWWAPAWMRRVQNRIGLGEITLEDEERFAAAR
ncbi:MMPL family transporter [Nocardia huaxiensis]|uniref:MMPL family transporter n=1 Tax=Nocardia huaxiensis TaxID=2755382 RepID=A0A7D6VDF9_9NOCA|nr:MMPL family transporter [Nocardia huaxiensis]QLY27596.1 MMPL family transporter [Nocardia huaxiensis]UFS99023.1 MMPL family transporter [Nocardia huaxiensis]